MQRAAELHPPRSWLMPPPAGRYRLTLSWTGWGSCRSHSSVLATVGPVRPDHHERPGDREALKAPGISSSAVMTRSLTRSQCGWRRPPRRTRSVCADERRAGQNVASCLGVRCCGITVCGHNIGVDRSDPAWDLRFCSGQDSRTLGTFTLARLDVFETSGQRIATSAKTLDTAQSDVQLICGGPPLRPGHSYLRPSRSTTLGVKACRSSPIIPPHCCVGRCRFTSTNCCFIVIWTQLVPASSDCTLA